MKTGAFRIFVLGFEDHTATEPLFQIYGSSLDNWHLCSYPSSLHVPIQPSTFRSAVLYNGAFHDLFYDIAYGAAPHPHGIQNDQRCLDRCPCSLPKVVCHG